MTKKPRARVTAAGIKAAAELLDALDGVAHLKASLKSAPSAGLNVSAMLEGSVIDAEVDLSVSISGRLIRLLEITIRDDLERLGVEL